MTAGRGPDLSSVWLAAGAHPAPRRGVCVVELASMVAEERFSDRPRCVCPVIAGFLRGLNDRLPHFDRQFLLPYSHLIVGSRAGRRLTRERRRICLDWIAGTRSGPVRAFAARIGVRARLLVRRGPTALLRASDAISDEAARLAVSGDTEIGFELLERLLDTVPGLVDAAPTPETASEPSREARRPRRRTGRFRMPRSELNPELLEPLSL